MSKVTIAGNAVVITSSLTMEELETVKKYRPKELVLKGGEDGKEAIFAIAVAPQGEGSANEYGIAFDSTSNDGTGKASVTLVAPSETDDIVKGVVDSLGGAIMNLNKLEAHLVSVLEEIDADKTAVMENITVAQ